MIVTNTTDIPLSVAIWLASDGYDLKYDPKQYSATDFVKPVKAVVLERRIREGKAEIAGIPIQQVSELSELIKSRAGQAIHDSIENTWRHADIKSRLRQLGHVVDKVSINDPTAKEGYIVWIEKRENKEFNGVTISGKYDLIINGRLHDYKTGQTFKYTKNMDKDYQIQGSIYKWLNPELITEDEAHFEEIYLDWSKTRAMQGNNNYPNSPVITKKIPLMSITETEEFLLERTNQFNQGYSTSEDDLPPCTSEDLWMDPPTYKYFSRPGLSRATKNFDTDAAGAYAMANLKGGYVEVVQGKPKRCGYCSALPICQQGQANIGV